MNHEVILTAGYALFLMACATALTASARRSEKSASAADLAPWPRSDEHQLRRGVALALTLLTAFMLIAQLLRHPQRVDVEALGLLLAVDVIVGWRVLAALRPRREAPGSR